MIRSSNNTQKRDGDMNHRKTLHVHPAVVATVICLIFGTASNGLAQNLIVNGSFESGNYPWGNSGAGPDAADLPAGSTAITGWTLTLGCDVSALQPGNPYGTVPEDGQVSIDLTGYQDHAPYGGVTQSISTVPGANYDLSFWVGIDNGNPADIGPAAVTAFAGSASAVFANTLTGNGNQWEQFNLPFTADSSPTTITVVGEFASSGHYIGLDNVSVAAVPEPASLSLLTLTAPALLARRRSKTSTNSGIKG